MKILIADDEIEIRKVLRLLLENAGHSIVEAADGSEAADAVRLDSGIDLCIMDITMPKMNGVEATKRIREFSTLPILFLTARSLESDKEAAYSGGGDDYLVKPFGIMEMVSRVKAVLRRCRPKLPDHLLKRDGLVLNPQERTVSIDGERVNLTYKEYELLHLFLTQPGIAFTREQLLSSVWNTEYLGETRTVDMHIRTLRQKLGTYGHLIETVRNVGYRLEAKHDK